VHEPRTALARIAGATGLLLGVPVFCWTALSFPNPVFFLRLIGSDAESPSFRIGVTLALAATLLRLLVVAPLVLAASVGLLRREERAWPRLRLACAMGLVEVLASICAFGLLDWQSGAAAVLSGLARYYSVVAISWCLFLVSVVTFGTRTSGPNLRPGAVEQRDAADKVRAG
jgi:hypothetical protein